jgi:hypothetical protein
MKFTVTYSRNIQVEVEAATTTEAAEIAVLTVKNFSGIAKVLSIVAADYIERPCPGCAEPKEAVPSLTPPQPSSITSGFPRYPV